ncbi:sigma-70 family RNA polymerase sigma factor [Nocardioides sp. C4-1]|uniref:sigma-70 family RNA polymerase sigma factor n=1 Tax=Nocardioides sp. C4-1 TaxID=3151851 RepID=UPI0032676BED
MTAPPTSARPRAVDQPARDLTDHDDRTEVVLTPLGARGAATRLSRSERSQRTARLLQLAAAADGGERVALLDEVVVLNCRVADAVASRYRDRGVAYEDLQQAAYEGLVKAVHRFDGDHADDLLTFAVPTIRGEVQRYFRDRSWMVRPPRRIQELQQRVSATIAAQSATLGREPTDAEVCAELGIGPEEHAEVVRAFGCFRPSSLDHPLSDDDGSATVGDVLADDRESHGAAEARVVLGPAVRRLGPRDQRLVFLRFFEERTQREIGAELGLTQTQVSRQLERVLRDIRTVVDGRTDSMSSEIRSA